ncbi:MAG: hypothetical protein HYZ27_11275 [Deltaproteobacteria bacterium]|nr:hypothetical protein [Deltaproteobacteria bacterium]
MWSMVKTMVYAAVLGVMVYALFFIPVAGKTLAAHLVEVWRSPVVEEKRDILKDALKKELENRLAAQGERAGRQLAHGLTQEDLTHEELSDKDREALTEMLRQESRGP